MTQGRILKGIGGFYYVLVGSQVYACKARGIFKKRKVTPMVGDAVQITIQTEEPPTGVIEEIMERQSILTRPSVANVDQAIIVFAVQNPDLHPILLDKLLILCDCAGITPLICFNKSDLEIAPRIKELVNIYRDAGYNIMLTSALVSDGIEELEDILKDHVSVFAGPSGVGKSSLLNELIPGIALETGMISEKIGRGRHTTRHSELIPLKVGGWVVDTPGFTSLDMTGVDLRGLGSHYKEFRPLLEGCKFGDCSHLNEPDCNIKAHVGQGIHPIRYESYKTLYAQILEDRRNKTW